MEPPHDIRIWWYSFNYLFFFARLLQRRANTEGALEKESKVRGQKKGEKLQALESRETMRWRIKRSGV